MTKLLAAMQNSILEIESSKSGWKTREHLKGSQPQSIAIDYWNPSRAYCGTFNDGLWKTDDGGQSWDNIDKFNEFQISKVTSVSVSQLNEGNGRFNKVYVGTEPSTLFTSNNGGESWEKLSALSKLPSSTLWSFPPRPWTSHVRWIEPDQSDAKFVFVAVEAGALVKSQDGGKTWIDRVEGGPYDTHTLATHKKAPKRLYSSAGDGYFESRDYGMSWTRPSEGLKHDYLGSLAVDSGNPQTVIVSGSSSPMQAHARDNAYSLIYRKSDDNEIWHAVSKGLPEPVGTIISVLSSSPYKSGEFYAINNRGIFVSKDSGLSWEVLDIEWSKEYVSQHPFTIAVGKE